MCVCVCDMCIIYEILFFFFENLSLSLSLSLSLPTLTKKMIDRSLLGKAAVMDVMGQKNALKSQLTAIRTVFSYGRYHVFCGK